MEPQVKLPSLTEHLYALSDAGRALSKKSTAVSFPTEAILRAYGDLITQSFLLIRAYVGSMHVDPEEIRELADAMHNISSIFVSYGVFMNDEKYRELYLRQYDTRWARNGFGLEAYLQSRISFYSES